MEKIQTNSDHLIDYGKWVIVTMPSGNQKLIQIEKDVVVDLGKFGSFKPEAVVGKPLGTSFEIISKDKLNVFKKEAFVEIDDLDSKHRNNEITDDNTSQSLSNEDILDLKRKGLQGEMRGEEIVKSLVQNSASFEKRSEFAQAKYLLKKKQKFMRVFAISEPNAYSLCDFFFRKGPTKILNLRVDSLSQLLNMANVRGGMRGMIFDNTQGLVTAAVLDRMGTGIEEIDCAEDSSNLLLGIHELKNHTYDAVRFLNRLGTKISKSILRTLCLDKVVESGILKNDTLQLGEEKYWKEKPDESTCSKEEMEDYERGRNRFLMNKERSDYALAELEKGDFDSLIITSKFHPDGIIKSFKKFLSPSGSLVVYSEYREVLSSTFLMLRSDPEFINVQLSETWMREYQAHPGRMHPQMVTSSTGGYLLSAIKVIRD